MPRGKVKEIGTDLAGFVTYGKPKPVYKAKFLKNGIEIDREILSKLEGKGIAMAFILYNNKIKNILYLAIGIKGYTPKGADDGFEVERTTGGAPCYIQCDEFFTTAKFPIHNYLEKSYEISVVELNNEILYKIDLSKSINKAKVLTRKSRKGIKLGPRKKPEVEAVQEKPQEKPTYRKLDLGDQRPATPQFSKAMGEKVLKSFTE